ncbi:MAG: bacterioferritin [Alistipes sp.]|nr:bacterioferritin [Alistipes sp.]
MEQQEKKYAKSIDRLNEAVRMEIASTLQYMYFHVHFEDAGYEYLAKLMKQTSISEMRHIEELSERIMYLEGDVDMNPLEKTVSITNVSEALTFAMNIEQSTIDKYNEWSRLCSAEDDAVTHRIFQNLAEQEEEHLDIFRTELQNMKDYGEQNYLALQSIAHSKSIVSSHDGHHSHKDKE